MILRVIRERNGMLRWKVEMEIDQNGELIRGLKCGALKAISRVTDDIANFTFVERELEVYLLK